MPRSIVTPLSLEGGPQGGPKRGPLGGTQEVENSTFVTLEYNSIVPSGVGGSQKAAIRLGVVKRLWQPRWR